VVLEPGDLGGSIPGTGEAAGVEEEPPVLTRKKGRPEATIVNLVAALEKPIFTNMRVRHDRFRDAVMFCRPGSDEYQQFTDMHYTELRCHYERTRRFQPISKDMTRDAVLAVAKRDSFDSAMTWLDRQVWDGTARVEMFLSTYFGVPDSAYARAVSRYIWTALAGRTMVPGVKADMVPILVGGQGARKSSAVAAMVVCDDFFTELQLDSKEDDMSRKMRGCQIAELAELQGLHTKALESIKAFVSRQHESWVPKYQEFSTKFARRLLFIGTTNQDEFLADETGNRRWLPVRVDGFIDIEGIERDRAQLWAEAADLFVLGGVEYREAETLAVAVHAEHMMTDAWQGMVEQWLDKAHP
jgi:predicted P-loop ATPase